jgi:hypothetical protein
MIYRLGFDGPVSGELAQLLLGVEARLNSARPGISAQAGASEASPGGASSPDDSKTKSPHDPPALVFEDPNTYFGLAAGVLITIFVVWILRTRETQPTPQR